MARGARGRLDRCGGGGDWPLALHLAGSFLGANRDLRPQAYIRQLREQRLLQHSSLRGRLRAPIRRLGHEPDSAHTFAVSYEQPDFANPIGWVDGQHLARIVCPGSPIEPILLTLLFDSYRDVDKGISAELRSRRQPPHRAGFSTPSMATPWS